MKNSESEIMTKQQKATTIIKSSKNNVKNDKNLKDKFAKIINKTSKTNALSITSDEEEENLSSGEEGDDLYTDIDSQSETTEENTSSSSSSTDKDSDTESTSSSSSESEENDDVIIKRYISNHLDEIIDDAGVLYAGDDDDDDVEVSEDDEDSDEDEDGDDDDDDGDEDYDEDYEDASFDDFLNEISYNFLMSDEMFNNEIYSDPEQDNPSYADVIITEVNDDVIKEVEGWKDNETKTEGDCSEAKPIN